MDLSDVRNFGASGVRVVLIAETEPNRPSSDPMDKTLRMMDDRYIDVVKGLFNQAGYDVVHYNSPRELINNVDRHEHDVVFSLWHGDLSHNAAALVPSICEACELRYIGADAHARVVCDDKWLSRDLAGRIGLRVPRSVRIDGDDERTALAAMKGPLVAKPINGGTSMGVFKIESQAPLSTLVDTVRAIRRQFEMPVVVEEFCPGRELMIVILGTPDRIDIFSAIEIYRPDDEDYFVDRIFDAHLKQHMSSKEWRLRDVTAELDEVTKARCVSVFRSLGHIHYLRIDGRLHRGQFTFIELSPTPHFRSLAAINGAALQHGETLIDMIRRLVDLSQTPRALPAASDRAQASEASTEHRDASPV